MNLDILVGNFGLPFKVFHIFPKFSGCMSQNCLTIFILTKLSRILVYVVKTTIIITSGRQICLLAASTWYGVILGSSTQQFDPLLMDENIETS